MSVITNLSETLYAIAVAPTGNPSVLYAATDSGVYRSVDGAQTWVHLPSLPLGAGTATTALAIASDGAERATIYVGGYGVLYRSEAFTERWHVCVLPMPPSYVTSITISSNIDEDRIILVGTAEDGVFRSNDSGEHWATWNFGLLDLHVLALAISPTFASDETVVAATETGIFRSTNGGRAWREIPIPVEQTAVLCLTFVSQPDGQLILYAGTETDGLWVSSDAGEHWQIVLLRLRDSINALSVPAPGVLCFEQGGNLLCFSTTTNSVINMDSLIAQSASTAMAVWRDELQQLMILVGTSEGQLETVRFRADPGVPFTKDYSLE